MVSKVSTFLMFEGHAEEAMNFYVSLFPGATVESVQRYGAGEAGTEGSVKVASFQIHGHAFMCSDSPVKHGFTFTPSISVFVDCDDDQELTQAFQKLSNGGKVYMPLDNYGFSRRFGWVGDRFGVSWQLNWPAVHTPE